MRCFASALVVTLLAAVVCSADDDWPHYQYQRGRQDVYIHEQPRSDSYSWARDAQAQKADLQQTQIWAGALVLSSVILAGAILWRGRPTTPAKPDAKPEPPAASEVASEAS